ncbi:MAG: hypothetical protein ABIL76_01025 [candidate division WOR-3 bacterium]
MELKSLYDKKIEEVKEFRTYSKPQKKLLSDYQKICQILKFLDELKEEEFLNKLNKGEFKFQIGRVGYFTSKYFLKSRVVLNLIRLNNNQIDKKYIETQIALKLIANKLMKNKIVEKPKTRKSVIRNLIEFLRKNINESENFYLIRADFKSYTLNIRRNKVIEILRNKDVPDFIIKMIKEFINYPSIESKIFKNYPLAKFFNEIGYLSDYSLDGDYKCILGYEGILSGTPLSNVLGMLYLQDFDNFISEKIVSNGFYERYFDDLIIISSPNPKEIKKQINDYLSNLYQINKKDIARIFDIGENGNLGRVLEKGFEFLGYKFQKENNRIKISIRYKTLKKFAYKFIYEHRVIEGKYIECLVAKNYYLFSWLNSFIFINDHKLLEEIYKKIILPNIYSTLKNYLKFQRKDTSEDHLKGYFKEIKKFYKPASILRILRKGNKQKIIEKLKNLKVLIEEIIG